MKLLSIHCGGHDSSIAWNVDGFVRYLKFERELQEKHLQMNIWEVLRELPKLGIDIDSFDCVLVGSDSAVQLYPQLTFEQMDNFVPIHCEFFAPEFRVVHHHKAHAFSAWMMHNSPDIQISIDGFGDNVIASVIKSGDIIDQIEFPESSKELVRSGIHHIMESPGKTNSIGHEITPAGYSVGITGHSLDIAGKFMAFQSYGSIIPEFLEYLEKTYSIRNVDDMFDINVWGDITGLPVQAEDWAATVHYYAGKCIESLFDQHCKPEDVIVYTGGVALNVIWNTDLKKKYPNLYIAPHCGDEGLPLGMHEFARREFNLPEFSIHNFPYCQWDYHPGEVSDETIERAAQLLAEGNPIAWFQGNGELGPRALGNRSVLLDARLENGKELINNIKNRENYRPFGASCLKEYASDVFSEYFDDKHMLYVSKPKNNDYPAITHVDGTCRCQMVSDENPVFQRLLRKFYEKTGSPILLNTSLNISGKPIASSYWDGVDITRNVDIPYIFIGNQVFRK